MININHTFQSAFDGLMLGDGCISKSKDSKNYRYLQVCKHKEWLDIISYLLKKNGIENKIYVCKQYYMLESRGYVYLTMQHDRWYVKWYDVDDYPKIRWHKDEDGEWFIWMKIVPKDIGLTPECLINWYLGDGSIIAKTKKDLRLSTQGFTKDDCYFLSCLLGNHLSIYCYAVAESRYSDKYYITVSQNHIEKFFGYMKDCKHYIPCCYNYKFTDYFLYGLELNKEIKNIKKQIDKLEELKYSKILEIKKRTKTNDLKHTILKCMYSLK